MRSPSVSRSLGGRERTVRIDSGVMTSLHKDGKESKWDGSFWESARDLVSSLMRRRMASARRRILKKSLRTDLVHRWRGRLLLAGAGTGLWGNIVETVSIASPSIA